MAHSVRYCTNAIHRPCTVYSSWWINLSWCFKSGSFVYHTAQTILTFDLCECSAAKKLKLTLLGLLCQSLVHSRHCEIMYCGWQHKLFLQMQHTTIKLTLSFPHIHVSSCTHWYKCKDLSPNVMLCTSIHFNSICTAVFPSFNITAVAAWWIW